MSSGPVFIVWHVRHADFIDGSPTRHRDDDGELIIDDEDNWKVLGVFSTRDRAEARIERARSEPGFEAEPDCFLVDTYVVDEDSWADGFVSI